MAKIKRRRGWSELSDLMREEENSGNNNNNNKSNGDAADTASAATATARQPSAANISPALVSWAQQQQQQQDSTTLVLLEDSIEDRTVAAAAAADVAADVRVDNNNNNNRRTTTSDKNKRKYQKKLSSSVSERRLKQSVRLQMEQDRIARTERIVQDFIAVLNGKGDISRTDGASKKENRVAQLLALLQQLLEWHRSPTLPDTAKEKEEEEEVVATTTSSPDLLASWRQLTSTRVGSTTTAYATTTTRGGTPPTHVYRLAWVGSEETIGFVGTGLHKVPLARLDEVFLTLGGGSVPAITQSNKKNKKTLMSTTAITGGGGGQQFGGGGGGNRVRVEWLEVIRILGPFPNVKNTLQGYSTVRTMETASTLPPSDESTRNNNNKQALHWEIRWDSLTDGTGKQLLAGTDQNVRVVDLHLHLCEPSILLVTAVPPLSSSTSRVQTAAATTSCNPLADQGKYVMVFLREDDLDGKLDALRVI